MQRLVGHFLVFALVLTCVGQTEEASAKKKPVLNKKKVTLDEGKSVTLKVKNYKKKVKRSSSKKTVATVTQKGKVTAKKKGKATITAKVGKKKLKCVVTVKEKIVYQTLKIEDFENYEAGSDWANYTLGEGLTSGGTEEAHYLKPDETMKVVADPETRQTKYFRSNRNFIVSVRYLR